MNSYGTVEFAGDIEGNNEWDVFGPFTLDYSVTDKKSKCLPDNWAEQADEMAEASGRYVTYNNH